MAEVIIAILAVIGLLVLISGALLAAIEWLDEKVLQLARGLLKLE